MKRRVDTRLRIQKIFLKKRKNLKIMKFASFLNFYSNSGSDIVLNERKATKVLGIVFFSFFICWAPFFTHNIITAACGSECTKHDPAPMATIFMWLGYLSSTINPLIYTVFNSTFRRTFVKLILLRQKCCGRKRSSASSSSPPQRKISTSIASSCATHRSSVDITITVEIRK